MANVQPLDNPWKYDHSKEIRYVVIGDFVILAQNMRTQIEREPLRNAVGFHQKTVFVPYGEIYLAFYHEREFADGDVCLSEHDTVSGGVSIADAKRLAEQIDRAIKLVETGEVK